jgi:hypothetical protein
MHDIKVEVGQYRPVKKEGVFKATFSLVIYPYGQKILNCKYFVKGERRWFQFPSKEVTYEDGRKTQYIPYVSYIDKEYLRALEAAILEALTHAKPQEYNGQTKNPTPSYFKTPLQSKPSFDIEEPPF